MFNWFKEQMADRKAQDIEFKTMCLAVEEQRFIEDVIDAEEEEARLKPLLQVERDRRKGGKS